MLRRARQSGPVSSSVEERGLVRTDITAEEVVAQHAAYAASTAGTAAFPGAVLGYVTPVSWPQRARADCYKTTIFLHHLSPISGI